MTLLGVKSRSTIIIWENEGLLERITDPESTHGVFYRRRQIEALVDRTDTAYNTKPVEPAPKVTVRLKFEGKTYDLTLFELIEAWKRQKKEGRNAE